MQIEQPTVICGSFFSTKLADSMTLWVDINLFTSRSDTCILNKFNSFLYNFIYILIKDI